MDFTAYTNEHLNEFNNNDIHLIYYASEIYIEPGWEI